MSVDDQKLFNFDLEFHSGMFYECGNPDSVRSFQCLTSMSGKIDVARRLNSKMAGDEIGQAANSDA